MHGRDPCKEMYVSLSALLTIANAFFRPFTVVMSSSRVRRTNLSPGRAYLQSESSESVEVQNSMTKRLWCGGGDPAEVATPAGRVPGVVVEVERVDGEELEVDKFPLPVP